MATVTKGKFIGNLEKEVMEIIWSSKTPTSVKDVKEKLTRKRPVAYNTVMTIMSRLAVKGLLKRTPQGKAFFYKSTSSKDKFLSQISRQILKGFASSFGDIAIAHFAKEVEKIPADKRKRLLKMLKETAK